MKLAVGIVGFVVCAGCGGRAAGPAPVGGAPAGKAVAVGKAAPAADFTAFLDGDLDSGCVAASATEALCVTTQQSIQGGGSYELVWIGEGGREAWPAATLEPLKFDGHPRLDAATRAKAKARLAAGGFHPIGEPLGDVAAEPGTRPTLSADGVAVSWTTTALEDVDSGAGSWTKSREVVAATAPGACALVSEELEGAEIATLKAWPLGHAVVVASSVTWGIEGDRGGATWIGLVTSKGCGK